MSTKRIISQNDAGHLMIDHGLRVEDVQNALNTLPQPTEYTFYILDIMKYIKKNTN